jgi:hypothetical protein
LTTAVEIPPAPRHPDGVLIEPPAPLPPTTDRASARGVVALREPATDEAIRDLVRQYVHAWVSEDRPNLEQLLTADCVSLDATHLGRAALVESWRLKMQNLDYKKLAGAEIARFDRIERYAYAEVGLPGSPARPNEMRPGDVLVRVPTSIPRTGAEQLFPETIVLLLRRDDTTKLRIAGVGEN